MEGFFPQTVFTVFGIPVRDTVISTWIMMIIIAAVTIALRRRLRRPLEALIEFLEDTISGIMGRPAGPYLPFLGALFLFIAFANLLSILPAIPLPGNKMLPITSPTRDINTPVALAATVFFVVHYYGIRSQGALNYLKDLASPIYLAPLTFPLEIFSHLSRTVSMAVRLFGNVISTEMVVAVVFMLVPAVAPLPLTGLSMFTGLLQAYIFTSLATIFIGGALAAYEPEDGQSAERAKQTNHVTNVNDQKE
ncbi:MAG: F0F1 ATP synthase subunit A [Chloroflexota bacterium]|nr:F0F1 ATP synthase subunit A [Chloroflexota bacterium]